MLWLFFSQYKKNFVNNKTPKEHGEKTNTLYLHKLGHLAITNSETQQKSYKAQTNIIIRRGAAFGGDEEIRIRHTLPNAFYCICPVSTQWGRFAVISQHVNETPLFFFSYQDTIYHDCSRAGHWLLAPLRGPLLWVFLEAKNVEWFRILVLVSYNHSCTAQMDTRV